MSDRNISGFNTEGMLDRGRSRHRRRHRAPSGSDSDDERSSSPPPPRARKGLGRSKSDAPKVPPSSRSLGNQRNDKNASQNLRPNRGRELLGRSHSDVPKRSSVSDPSGNNAASSKTKTRKDLERTDDLPDSPSLEPSRSQLSLRPGPEEQVTVFDDEKPTRPSQNQASRRRPKPPPDEPSRKSPKQFITNVVKKYGSKTSIVAGALATTITLLDMAYHEFSARREARKHEEKAHRRERKDKREASMHNEAMNSYRERTSHVDLLLRRNELPEEHKEYISPYPHRGYRLGDDDERGRGSYEKKVYERRVSRTRY